jgi:predicted RNA-binding Zn-ribbon protein involved in translation (DUF1610 family)
MKKLLAKNTLIIPGKSQPPSDQSSGKKCPYCKEKIYRLKKKLDPNTQELKWVCPNCGREISV